MKIEKMIFVKNKIVYPLSCFTKKMFTCFFVFLSLSVALDLHAQTYTRDTKVDLLVNQVGYVPGAGKTVIAKELKSHKFEVLNVETQQVVFEGNFSLNKCDFGEYFIGDFSALKQEGHYYIKSDVQRSFPFRISEKIYRSPMSLIVNYFSLQRCGASETGFLSPCHIDDGVRIDNGKHQDLTGGWHDASDLRKWVSATIYGMIGLSKTYELLADNDSERDKIYDELLWGNLYFLKMQEPQGYVMNFVGGDIKENGDNNRWTDNIIGEDGGSLMTVKPNVGESMDEMLILGLKDDRILQTGPVDMVGQYNFIISEAVMSRIAKDRDPAYSQKCLQAAIKCFDWCKKTDKGTDAGAIGGSIQASLEMYKTTGQDIYKDFSIARASLLKKLQAKSQNGGVGGFFYTSFSDNEPFKDIWQGPLELISLCDLIQTFPTHKDVALWKEIVADYSIRYLSFFSEKNSFGIVPYGLFSKEDPGGNRKLGNYWYRYFMHPELHWWVGINANIASAGIGLIKASVVLNDPTLKSIAQKQLDWIIGVNPFNSSTIVGVGYNQPVRFINGGEFRPATPVLPGAVMNGLGGDKDDQPYLIQRNNYNQSEYWTPMVAYTLWLMGEITKNNKVML